VSLGPQIGDTILLGGRGNRGVLYYKNKYGGGYLEMDWGWNETGRLAAPEGVRGISNNSGGENMIEKIHKATYLLKVGSSLHSFGQGAIGKDHRCLSTDR